MIDSTQKDRTMPLASADLGAENRSVFFDGISFAAMVYLALPLLIFFCGWLQPYAAVFFNGLVLLGLGTCYRLIQVDLTPRCRRRLLVIFIVALVWTSLGGAGHIFYANIYDWSLRDAVLHDLVVDAWPVSYGETDGAPMMLRSPVAYFLPAAVLGKLFGVGYADMFLWGWTLLGVLLFLLLLPLPQRTFMRFSIGLAVVVLFSGMDVLGLLLTGSLLPESGDHIEWWASYYQLSSHATQLFWVPNHTLPGWLAAALFLRHWKQANFVKMAPFLLALLPLWSPFAVIGIGPFLAIALGYAVKTGTWRHLRMLHCLPAIFIFAFGVLYLAMDIGGINSSPIGAVVGARGGNNIRFLASYALFVSLEFGVLSFVLLSRGRAGLPVWIATAVLLLLPTYSFGPGNDLVMRASIPALVILCAACLAEIDLKSTPDNFSDMVALAIILLIGAVTPVNEILRAVNNTHWDPDLEHNLLDTQANHNPPAHYVGRLKDPLLIRLFKPPVDYRI